MTARLFLKILLVNLLAVSMVAAHVGLIFPQGGEMFVPGEEITLRWENVVDHGEANWDLMFSADSGKTWQTIAADIPKPQLEYPWTMPQIETAGAKIQVIQDNETYMDYNDTSSNFTIQSPTGIINLDNPPQNFTLFPAYPNPFNSVVTISFYLPTQSKTTIEIFNIIGERIRILLDSEIPPGNHSIRWEAGNLPSSVYFYRITTNGNSHIGKLMYIR